MKLSSFIQSNFGSLKNLVYWGFNAGIYITIAGLFTSRFAISLGMIVMGAASLLNLATLHKAEIIRRTQGRGLLFMTVLFLFVSVLTSFVGSEELGFAWVRFRLYAAFFLLPLIILFSPELHERHYRNYFLFALIGAIFSTSLVFMIYARDFEKISAAMGMGQPIPTPIPHIRYGMFVSFTFLLSFHAVVEGYFKNFTRLWVGLGAIFLLAAILILSVRTAWMVTFTGLMALMVYYVFKYKRILPAIATLAICIFLAYGSYFVLPSFKHKVDYMLYDWSRYRSGEGEAYSDSERVYSLKNGYSLWQQNFIWGVGSGDLHKSLKVNGKIIGVPANQIPHNQFLLTAVCGGLISLVLFMTGFISLMYYQDVRRSFPVTLLICLYLLTLFFEPTFETSVGVLSFVFIVCIAVKCALKFKKKDVVYS